MKKLRKQAMGFIGTGATLGVGASVLTQVGSTKGAEALGNMASFLPMMGTMTGASGAFRALKGLKVKKRRK